MVKLSAILRINVHITPEFFAEIIILYYFDIYNIFDLVKSSIFFYVASKYVKIPPVLHDRVLKGIG